MGIPRSWSGDGAQVESGGALGPEKLQRDFDHGFLTAVLIYFIFTVVSFFFFLCKTVNNLQQKHIIRIFFFSWNQESTVSEGRRPRTGGSRPPGSQWWGLGGRKGPAQVLPAPEAVALRLFATPWTAAHQAPPPMGFSRQEYWSGLPLPSPHLLLVQYYFQN